MEGKYTIIMTMAGIIERSLTQRIHSEMRRVLE
jgi:hypothetical protein